LVVSILAVVTAFSRVMLHKFYSWQALKQYSTGLQLAEAIGNKVSFFKACFSMTHISRIVMVDITKYDDKLKRTIH